jgi:hypothetical protein
MAGVPHQRLSGHVGTRIRHELAAASRAERLPSVAQRD